MRSLALWPTALATAACLLAAAAAVDVGLIQGDTTAEIFVNGVYIVQDTTLPALPLNNIRQQLADGAATKVYSLTTSLNSGDLIAIKVQSSRPQAIPVTDAVGVTMNYSGYSGLKAAFSDGTMTDEAWQCTQDFSEPAEPPADYIAWFSPYFKEGLPWPQAVVQDESCCPWRDAVAAWRDLNALWIAAPWGENYTNGRVFYCRYRVGGDGPNNPLKLTREQGSRLPWRETENSTLVYSKAMGCQTSYSKLEEGCFRYYDVRKTFSQANASCAASAIGGALASIDGESQNAAAFALTGNQRTLFGITDAAVEGKWRTAFDGQLITYDNWNVTALEPNTGAAENCAGMIYTSGMWGDVPCESAFPPYEGYLCRSEACAEFSGNWNLDQWGYRTENLTQYKCVGENLGEEAELYDVLGDKIILRSGSVGNLKFFDGYDELHWEDGLVWTRYLGSPVVQIRELKLSSSNVQVSFNITRRASVSCNIVDARFLLRTPTALELETQGKTLVVDPTKPGFIEIGDGQSSIDYDVTVLETQNVVIIEECEDLCMLAYPKCVFMTFFLTGSDLATGRNCRLASAWNESSTKVSASAIFQHRSLVEQVVVHHMQITGMIVPGQIYNAYCKTRDVYTGVHSTLSMIGDTKFTERAAGAVDGGLTNKPRVQLLGGFASRTELVPVAKANRPGRIFCAAFAGEELPDGNWTAGQIKAQGFYSILVIANQSVPVRITGREPTKAYEVGCVADGDGGIESTPEDIQATRRWWTTEAVKPTIETMTAEIVPPVSADAGMKINTYVQITELGYLWCLVVDSNATETLGVPRASVIKEDGLVQKVADLRTAAAGSFEDLPENSTWEVYCTAEFNDFSNETDSDSMASPFPVAKILQHEVYPNRLKLWVKVDRGPSAVYCQAFMWSDNPTTRRPTTPLIPTAGEWLAAPRVGNGKDLQELLYRSPWDFVVASSGGGVAVFDIAPLATGSWHDVYCYAEVLAEDVPAGAEPPPRQGMTVEAIRKTLLVIKTVGPSYEDGGWHCVSGRPCNITGVRGDGLTSRDRVLVRADPCPGICQCSGNEDPLRKGGRCSPVSQDPVVLMPLPGVLPDRLDPRGEWCYVDAGACTDGQPSKRFPQLTLSYKACSYNAAAGPSSGPQGFPLKGLAKPLTPTKRLVTQLYWVDLDCPRLTWWKAYSGAFELNVRQAFLVAMGQKYQSKDIEFEYTVGTTHGECFVDVSVVVPPTEDAFMNLGKLRTAVDDWLPDDIYRRVTEINLIRNTFLGYDRTVTLKSLSNPIMELDPIPGTAFGWGQQPLVAPGAGYHLCYCNGTESNCLLERHYGLALGRLHLSGPTAAQIASTETCVDGLRCEVSQLAQYGAANGSRLVVLPSSPQGCKWKRANLGYPPGVAGFLNSGVSDTAVDFGARYLWGGGLPLVVAPGVYTLCWCGPPVLRTRPEYEKDVPYAEGGFQEACPSMRPEDGAGFWAPAGQLRVVGPALFGSIQTCKIGQSCTVQGVTGEGVRGGDTVMILRDCGEEPPLSDRYEWTTQGPGRQVSTTQTTTSYTGLGQASGLPPWIEGGWIDYGPRLTDQQLASIGIGGPTGRGALGVPEKGISERNARIGYYPFPGPLWALAGDYQICWCAGGQGGGYLDSIVDKWPRGTGGSCTLPEDFLVPVGALRVTGPAVKPMASQVFQCVRRRACEILGFKGTMPEGSKLLIAEGECGGAAKPGSPNGGVSLNSIDGHDYSWGDQGMFLDPGLYRLCWCASVITCMEPRDYAAYSGLLQIKAPLSPPKLRFCQLGKPCNITGIYGPGLSNADKVAVLAACGSGDFTSKFTQRGISILTFDLGQGFTLPPSLSAGAFRVCWCAGENLCVKAWDFDADLGGLTVGGPDPSLIYLCFEWQPCSITVKGALLEERDMIRVVPPGTSCAETASSDEGPPIVDGFPRYGVALPSTAGGYEYSFGDGLVHTVPGVYDLCYCSFKNSPNLCQNATDFYTPGGTLRIGDSKEYQYITRDKDPEPRSGDKLYAILLAVCLPLLFILAGVAGWGRRRLVKQLLTKGRAAKGGKVWDGEAEAPPLFPPRMSFAALGQKKTKEMYEVKQVLEIRLAAPGSAERGGMAEFTKRTMSPKSLASITDIPDFRSELARRKARRRERGEDSDLDEDHESSGEGEDPNQSFEEAEDQFAELPGMAGDAPRPSLGGRRPSTVSQASGSSSVLRIAAQGTYQTPPSTTTAAKRGSQASMGSMMGVRSSLQSRSLFANKGATGRQASAADSEWTGREVANKPQPPSMEFANYLKSSRILDMLEM